MAGRDGGAKGSRRTRKSRREARKQTETQELNSLLTQLERVLDSLEAIGLDDYLALRNDGRRMLRRSFWTGIARGLGAALGFTVLGALALYLLQRTVMTRLPALGEFFEKMLRIIQGS